MSAFSGEYRPNLSRVATHGENGHVTAVPPERKELEIGGVTEWRGTAREVNTRGASGSKRSRPENVQGDIILGETAKVSQSSVSASKDPKKKQKRADESHPTSVNHHSAAVPATSVPRDSQDSSFEVLHQKAERASEVRQATQFAVNDFIHRIPRIPQEYLQQIRVATSLLQSPNEHSSVSNTSLLIPFLSQNLVPRAGTLQHILNSQSVPHRNARSDEKVQLRRELQPSRTAAQDDLVSENAVSSVSTERGLGLPRLDYLQNDQPSGRHVVCHPAGLSSSTVAHEILLQRSLNRQQQEILLQRLLMDQQQRLFEHPALVFSGGTSTESTNDVRLRLVRAHQAGHRLITNSEFQASLLHREPSLLDPGRRYFGQAQPPPGQSSVTLYLEGDEVRLSGYQTLVRQQLELFEAQQHDVDSDVQGRKKKVRLGQVGIRCRHCASCPLRVRGRGAVYYPSKLSSVYQAAQNMASGHLSDSCQRIPDEIRGELHRLRRLRETASRGKQYWVVGCRLRGLAETPQGLWFAKASNMAISDVASRKKS